MTRPDMRKYSGPRNRSPPKDDGPPTVSWEKVYKLARNIARAATGTQLYPFQEALGRRITRSLVTNEGAEIVAECSRQLGKSQAVACIAFGLANAMPLLGLEPVRIGIFAPRLEQSKIIFTRVKDCFNSTLRFQGENLKLMEQLGIEPQENNGVTFKTNLGSSITCQSASPEANIEGLTLDMVIIEEAQGVEDRKLAVSVFPMCANTNGTRVLIGTPAFHKGYFYNVVHRLKGTPDCFIVPWREGARQKRERFERDGNPMHLRYEKYVESEMRRLGPDSDAFLTQYSLEWLIERGMFVTYETLVGKCGAPYDPVPKGIVFPGTAYNYVPVYAGLDIAKTVDQTVLTIGSWHNPLTFVPDGYHYIYDWMEISGDNYEDQFEDLKAKLDSYQNVKCLTIDEQGRGAHMADKFRRTKYPVLGIITTRKENDRVFRPFLDAVPARHTLRFPMGRAFTGLDSVKSLTLNKCQRRFIGQLTNAEKEYHGEMLDIHNKDDAEDPHDDFCFAADTPVRMADGRYKPIQDVAVGEEVSTQDGARRVVKVHHRRVRSLLQVKPLGRPAFCVTANHPFKTEVGGYERIANLGLLRKDITPLSGQQVLDLATILQSRPGKRNNAGLDLGKLIVTDTAIRYVNGRSNPLPRYVKLDYKLGYIVGAFAAEGSFGKHNIQFTVRKENEVLEPQLSKFFREVFGLSLLRSELATAVNLYRSSHLLRALFQAIIPGRSEDKRLAAVGFSNMGFLRGFIAGLFKGDGCFAAYDRRFQLSTTSPVLAAQVCDILEYFGIYALMSVSRRKGRVSYIGATALRHNFDLHIVKITHPEYTNCFSKLFWPEAPEVPPDKFHKPKQRWAKGCVVIPCTKRRVQGGEVFNLEVEDNNQYTVLGATVHNCDSAALELFGALTWREGGGPPKIGEHRMEAHDIFESGGMEGVLHAPPARELPFDAMDPRRIA